MSGQTITVNSSLQCPHGGQVQIISSQSKATADQGFIGTIADTYVISGCPFQIPGTPPIPSPCVKVQWLKPDVRSTVNGMATVSSTSTGICLAATQLPQGPVSVVNTQTKVTSS